MKKIIIFSLLFLITVSASLLSGCAASKEIAEKSGVQLWGENCNRCHNAPSMDQYSKQEWTVIGTHMKLKAGLTNDEVTKIVAYLSGSGQ